MFNLWYNLKRVLLRFKGAVMKKPEFEKVLSIVKQNIVKPITEIIPSAKSKITKSKRLFQDVYLESLQKLKAVDWKSRKVWGPVLILLAAAASTGFYYNTTVPAALVYINGNQIGLVSSVDQGKQLVAEVLQEKGQAIGQSACTHDQIAYRGIRIKKDAAGSGYLSDSDISNILNTYIDGVELSIAGEKVAILPSQEDVQNTLQALQDYYNKPSETNVIESTSFAEEITTAKIESQPEEVQTAETVLEILKKGKTTDADYIVKDTDTWWLIARNNNMLTKDVLACNPGTTEKTALRPGQKIKLVSSTPYLTVISKGVLTQSQAIPFEVQNVIDNSLEVGQQVVKQEGSEGQKQIITAYTQKNGTVIEKQVLDEHVNKEPVTRVVAKAPNLRVYSVAYASSRGSARVSGLCWPLRSNVSSPFGYRGRDFHPGIDIAARTGTPFVAAASGTVIQACYSGGYGNMILINHGNGAVTRYGHASKLMVSAGQHVEKGQTVGLVGSTGYSTGPHLHFEVIINGQTVNPRNNLP
jgi:murein DD-endopeptidase MepM/ murein hydrolase activator NlpD